MKKERRVFGWIFVVFLVILFAGNLFLTQRVKSAAVATTPPEQEMTFYAFKDAHVDEANPTQNYGGSVNLAIGNDGASELRGLLDFWMSDLPIDAVVISATLQIGVEVNMPPPGTNSPEVELYQLLPHAVTSSWNENTVTWNNKPDSVTKGDPVVDIPPKASGWIDIDVTKIVQSWVEASQMKYGIMLLPSRSTTMFRYFTAREGPAASAPRLVVRYTSEIPTETPTSTPSPTEAPPSKCPGTVIIYADQDTTTDSSAPTSEYGTQKTLLVGQGPGYTFNTFLHFPIEAEFGPGDYIYNAALTMNIADSYLTKPFHELMAFTLNGTFDEAATNWGNQPYMRIILPLPVITQNADFVWWDMTSPVRKWMDGTEENTGLGIMPLDPGSEFWFEFHSREADLYGVKPRLIIECGDTPPTPTPTSTNTPTPTPTPVPTDPPPITLDLEVLDMEITQGLQDLHGSIPMIADKRTFVRLYVLPEDSSPNPPDVYQTTARLWVYRGGVFQEILRPINNPYGLLDIKQEPHRTKLDDAFLFELPSQYTTEGEIRLIGEVNSEYDIPYLPETDDTNNSQTETIVFEPTKDLALGIYEIHYFHPEDHLLRYPSYSDIMSVLARLRNEFPISGTPYFIRTLLLPDEHYVSESDFEYVNEYLEAEMFYDAVGGEEFIHSYDTVRYHGLWVDLSSRFPGIDPFIPPFTGDGKSNGIPGVSATSFLDNDSTPGHELGHNFGRHHTWEPDCRAGTGCSDFWWGACPSGFEQFPYDDGQLGPTEYEWLGSTIFGFSSYLNTNAVMYYPNVKDTMTYCGRWMSDFTFERIRSAMGPDTLNTIEKTRRKESAPAPTGDFLVVSGSISNKPGEIDLSPIFMLPNIAYNFEAQRGPFEIVLKDARGVVLASYPFTPDVGWDSQSSLGLNDPVPPPSATFFEIIPYHADATSLGIVWRETFLEGVQAGITPPTVNLLYPNGGEILDTDPITVTWTAGDPEERSDLDYRISYSKDDGSSWDLVASGITETHATIPRANLPATTRGLFRVWASDGIHTGFDDSDGTFIVPNAPPYLEITSPISGTIFVISQTVTLQANAYDPDSGSMDGEQIVWFSTINGEIGNGDLLSLSDLSAGEHTILAVAVDGKGGMAGDSVKITIYQDAQHLPQLPGVLAVSPGGIYFKPSHGIVSQELEVYNANLGDPIPWEAVPGESWIKISPAMASGSTRSWIKVTVDTTGLDFGRYQGAILFSNLENPRDRVVLPVELVYTPETVYLPVVIR